MKNHFHSPISGGSLMTLRADSLSGTIHFGLSKCLCFLTSLIKCTAFLYILKSWCSIPRTEDHILVPLGNIFLVVWLIISKDAPSSGNALLSMVSWGMSWLSFSFVFVSWADTTVVPCCLLLAWTMTVWKHHTALGFLSHLCNHVLGKSCANFHQLCELVITESTSGGSLELKQNSDAWDFDSINYRLWDTKQIAMISALFHCTPVAVLTVMILSYYSYRQGGNGIM